MPKDRGQAGPQPTTNTRKGLEEETTWENWIQAPRLLARSGSTNRGSTSQTSPEFKGIEIIEAQMNEQEASGQVLTIRSPKDRAFESIDNLREIIRENEALAKENAGLQEERAYLRGRIMELTRDNDRLNSYRDLFKQALGEASTVIRGLEAQISVASQSLISIEQSSSAFDPEGQQTPDRDPPEILKRLAPSPPSQIQEAS